MPTARQSRIPASQSMAKVDAEIDNGFTPSPLPEGSLFCVVFGVAAMALVTGVVAFFRSIGVL